MIIHTVVQNAISRARRRRLASKTPRIVERAEPREVPPHNDRESLGVLVVVLLVIAFGIAAFIAAR